MGSPASVAKDVVGVSRTLVAFGVLAVHITAQASTAEPAAPFQDLLRLGEIEVSLGGGAALLCTQLARLGHLVDLVPMVGADALGTFLLGELGSTDVGCPISYASGDTARTLIRTDDLGGHDITFAPSDADPAPLAAEVYRARGAAFAYSPGFPGFEPVLEGLSLQGVPVVVDLGYRPWLSDKSVYRAEALLRSQWADVAALSGAGLAHAELASLMREIANQDVDLVVATLGAEGAVVLVGSDLVHVPASPSKPVNTHGAGDVFAAGLIAGLTEGMPPELAVQLANSTAAAAISQFPLVPDRLCVDTYKNV